MSEEIKTEPVLLKPAFKWICPKCKKKNFISAIYFEQTDEEVRDYLDLEPYQEVTDEIRESAVTYFAPARVKCQECQERFDALDELLEDELNEDFDDFDEEDDY